MTARRAAERRHLDAFLELAGLEGQVLLHVDRPDFVLEVGGRRIARPRLSDP